MKLKDEAIKVLAISFGFVGASLFLSIGGSLCLYENWIGVIPLILGYEIARKTFLFMIKDAGFRGKKE